MRVLCENAGVGVKKLKRTRVGGLRLPSALRMGNFVQLKPHEVRMVMDKGAQGDIRHNSFGATPRKLQLEQQAKGKSGSDDGVGGGGAKGASKPVVGFGTAALTGGGGPLL